MTPQAIAHLGRRAFAHQLRVWGVDAEVGWEGAAPAKVRALVPPISRRQVFEVGGLQGEHDGLAMWLRESTDYKSGRIAVENIVPEIGMTFSLPGKTPTAPSQSYRIDEVSENPAAPFWQVGLTAL